MSAESIPAKPVQQHLSWLARCRAWWLRPRVLLAMIALLLAVCLPLGYRGYRLSLIPEIEEPFDTQAALSFQVPDEDNALLDFHQAEAHYVPLAARGLQEDTVVKLLWNSGIDVPRRWIGAPKQAELWLQDNQTALNHWVQGAAKPEFRNLRRGGTGTVNRPDLPNHFLGFPSLARADAARLSEAGQPEDAWQRLLAILRVCHHLDRRASLSVQYATNINYELRAGVSAWAQHPNTELAHLKRALQDIASEESRRGNPAVTFLRDEYLYVRQRIERRITRDDFPVGGELWPFINGEPEASLRAARHAYGFVLSEAQLPPHLRSRLNHPRSRQRMETPSSAEELIRLESAIFKTEFGRQGIPSGLPDNTSLWQQLDQNTAHYRLIQAVVAVAAFQREHGVFPETLHHVKPWIHETAREDTYIADISALRYSRSGTSATIWSVGTYGGYYDQLNGNRHSITLSLPQKKDRLPEKSR